MGMFDYVRCEYPLPDGHGALDGWQTKDTPAQHLDTYVITPDGRLLHAEYDIEDRSRCALAGHDTTTCTACDTLERFIGCMARTNERLVEVGPPFDGDICFHASASDFRNPDDPGDWVEYRATFRNGRVVEMTRIADRFAGV